MRNNGCDIVVELSWWDEFRHEKNGKEFVFACTPSQHCSQRTLTDSNKVDLIECLGFNPLSTNHDCSRRQLLSC